MAWLPKSSLSERHGEGASLARRESAWGILFISPWIIGFLIFTVAPMIASFAFTFFDFDLANPDQTHFIGLENWRRMLFTDPEVWPSYLRLLKLGIVILPVMLVGSLSCALLLNSRYLVSKNLFRTLFYLPSMVPMVAAALIWNGILNEYSGWVNIFLEKVLGVEGTPLDQRSQFDLRHLRDHRPMGHRQPHDHLPGRAPGRTHRTLRCSYRRWRWLVATFVRRDPAHDIARAAAAVASGRNRPAAIFPRSFRS